MLGLCNGLIKIIFLVMDIIVAVIGFFANWYLLFVFASENDPDVLQRDLYLHRSFYYIFVGFHFLAGLVMVCLLDGFKILIKCDEETKTEEEKKEETLTSELCKGLCWLFWRFLIIMSFGYFAQIIYKFKEITKITRED
jgi:hypothetical protein